MPKRFACIYGILALSALVVQPAWGQSSVQLERARQLHKEGKLSHAAVALTEILSKNPENRQALYERGLVYQKMILSERAVNDLTAYLEQGADALGHYYRALAHLQLSNASQAKSDLNQALDADPALADAHLYRGLANNMLRDYRSAVQDLDEAIAKNPNSFNALVYRGVAHYFAGNQRKAVVDYTAALRLKPRESLVYNNRGMAYLALGQTGEGFADLEKARRLSKGENDSANIAYESMINRLSHYLSSDQFNAAARYAKTIPKKGKSGEEVEVLLAAGLLKTGKVRQAERRLAGVLKANPSNVEALLLRALISFRRKNYEAAEQDLLQIVEQAPSEAYAHRLLGDVYYIQGQLRNAIGSYSAYLQLGGTEEVVFLNRAQASYFVRNYDSALQDYTRLIEANERSGTYLFGRGNVLYKLKRYEDAVGDYRRAVQLGEQSANIYIRLLDSLTELNDLAGAEQAASEGIEKHRKNADLFRLRANVHLKRGNTQGAITDYRASVKLKPDFDVYYRLGLLYNEVSDFKNAIASLTSALNLKSSHSLSYRYRGSVHEKLGQKEKAIADWEKGCKLGDETACDFLRRAS